MNRKKILLSMVIAAVMLVCWAGVAMATCVFFNSTPCYCDISCTSCATLCTSIGGCLCSSNPTPVHTPNTGTLKGDNAIVRSLYTGTPSINIELSGFYLNKNYKLGVDFSIGDAESEHQFSENGKQTVTPFPAGTFSKYKAGKYTIFASTDGNYENYSVKKTDIGYLWLRHAPKLSGDTMYTMFIDAKHEADFIGDLKDSDPAVETQLHAKVNGYTVKTSRKGDGRVIFHFTAEQLDSFELGTYPVYGWADASENSDAIAEIQIGTINIVERDCSMIVVRPLLTGVVNSPSTSSDFSFPAYVRHPIYGTAPGVYVKDKYPISIQGYLQKVELSSKVTKKAKDSDGTVINYNAKAKLVKIPRSNSYLFTFAAADMMKLDKGLYRFLVSSNGFKGNGRTIPALPFTQIGLVNVMTSKTPTDWSIPKTLTISESREYPLLTILKDGATPKVQFTAPRSLEIVGGRIMNSALGKATITAADEDGGYAECEVTVIPNMLIQPYPFRMERKGLYTSTHQVNYEGNEIRARVFLTNRTGQTIKDLNGFKYQVWVDGVMKCEKAITDQKLDRELKSNQAVSLILWFGDEELPGTSAWAYDLGKGQVKVVLSGNSVTAVEPSTVGAIEAKLMTRFGYIVKK